MKLNWDLKKWVRVSQWAEMVVADIWQVISIPGKWEQKEGKYGQRWGWRERWVLDVILRAGVGPWKDPRQRSARSYLAWGNVAFWMWCSSQSVCCFWITDISLLCKVMALCSLWVTGITWYYSLVMLLLSYNKTVVYSRSRMLSSFLLLSCCSSDGTGYLLGHW